MRLTNLGLDELTVVDRPAPVDPAPLHPMAGNQWLPSVKEDGSPFSIEDFATIAREMRPLASKLAQDTNLTHYQSIYDADNKKVKALFTSQRI